MTVGRRAEHTGPDPRTTEGSGFRNLLRIDARSFWGTRQWWIQGLVWFAIIIGLVVEPLYVARSIFEGEGEDILTTATNMFFTLAALGPAIAAIIQMQNAIVGEKQLGTAAWVLSKPVSRTAFVTSKLVSRALGLLATALVVPSVVGYVLLSLENGAPLSALRFLGGLGLVVLVVLFYLAFTLMLGTLFDARGPVIALPLALLLAGDLLVGAVPFAAQLLPSSLPSLATLSALGEPLPLLAPIVATAVWIVAFVLVAVERFRREEF